MQLYITNGLGTASTKETAIVEVKELKVMRKPKPGAPHKVIIDKSKTIIAKVK